MTNPAPTMEGRKFRAQERYAQSIIDHLWANADDMLVANADGVFYQSSLHQLIRRVLPSAQAGEVVNILTESGCVSKHGHGIWEIRRRNVFFDDDTGEPVNLDAVQFGHATKAQQTTASMQDLNRRVMDLEDKVGTLQAIVIGWAKERGEMIEVPEGGEPDEEDDTDEELGRDVVGDDGA